MQTTYTTPTTHYLHCPDLMWPQFDKHSTQSQRISILVKHTSATQQQQQQQSEQRGYHWLFNLSEITRNYNSHDNQFTFLSWKEQHESLSSALISHTNFYNRHTILSKVVQVPEPV